MPETKHTPGPWEVFQPEANDPHKGIDAANNTTIIRYGDFEGCNVGVQGATQEERDANAHLIASAPELYDALDLLIKDLEMRARDGVVDCSHGRYMAALMALAKARGEVAP